MWPFESEADKEKRIRAQLEAAKAQRAKLKTTFPTAPNSPVVSPSPVKDALNGETQQQKRDRLIRENGG